MNTVAEGRMVYDIPVEKDCHRLVILSIIQAMKDRREHEHIARLQCDALKLHILLDDAPDGDDGEIFVQILRRQWGIRSGLAAESPALRRMLREEVHHEPEKIYNRVEPANENGHAHIQDLKARQRAIADLAVRDATEQIFPIAGRFSC